MENKAKCQKYIFTEQEKESNRDFSVNSEEIASFVIEKLISLAITEEQRKKTNDQIPNKCFSYLTNMVKNYLKLEFMPYDRDDYFKENTSESLYTNDTNDIQQQEKTRSNWMPISNLKNKAFDDHSKNKNVLKEKNPNNINEGEDNELSNDSSHSTIKKEIWKQFQSMPSIDSVKLDHSFHNQIENQKDNYYIEKHRNIFFDNYVYGVNDWTINEEPASSKIDRNASTLIKMTKFNKTDKTGTATGDDLNNDRRNVYREKTIKFGRDSSIVRYGADADVNFIKERYKNEEMRVYKLENIPEFVEDPMIRDVRIEKERQLKKEEEDKVARKHFEKEQAEKLNELVKRQKEYEKKPTTTDSNGNLLLIKSYPQERLQCEFSIPRMNLVEKKEGKGENSKKESLKKEQNIMSDLLGKEEQQKKENSNSNNNMSLKQTIVENTNNRNIKNPKNFGNSKLGIDKNNIDIGPFVPAGSNFDLITPEVGVKIIEGSKEKNGGKDYFKFYQKYSKYDYTNLMRESENQSYGMTNSLLNLNTKSPGESKEFLKSRTSIKNNVLNNTVSNFSKKPTFDNVMSISNNTLQNIGNSIINSNNFSKSLNPVFKVNNIPTNTSYNSMNNTKISMMRSKGNLRSAMDTLDLIPEHDEKDLENIIENNVNNIDLFKNNKINLKSNYKERYKEDLEAPQKLDEINLFTKTILATNNWGDSYPKVGKNNQESIENTTYFKPQKKEIEKEIGKSILNTKLPRARLSTKAFETQNMNRMHKGVDKKENNSDGEKLFNSTSLSFLKASSFSKVFSQILSRKNN